MTNKYYHMSILKSTFTKYFDNIADPPTPLTRLTYPVKLKAEPARSTTSFGGNFRESFERGNPPGVRPAALPSVSSDNKHFKKNEFLYVGLSKRQYTFVTN